MELCMCKLKAVFCGTNGPPRTNSSMRFFVSPPCVRGQCMITRNDANVAFPVSRRQTNQNTSTTGKPFLVTRLYCSSMRSSEVEACPDFNWRRL